MVTYVEPRIRIDAATGELSLGVERTPTDWLPVEAGHSGGPASAKPAATPTLGDVNRDDRINVVDALMVATYAGVPRSGDFGSLARAVRSGDRNFKAPNYRYFGVGARIVRTR